ncbi:MAG TPA: hypothetical protein VI112_11225 [Bacteroidia bacterium]|jgi:hypothetical protein
MKRIFLLAILLCGFAALQAQTKADSVIGKWKYMGAMKSQAVYKTDPAWYKAGKVTPKYEFVEFKKGGKCTRNERGGKPGSVPYTVKDSEIIFDGITYKIKSIDAKNMTLYRGFYIVTDASGKQTRVDDEQISFTRVK